MRRSEEEGVRRQLKLGWRLLRSGQAREAADAFGRVLLRRPGLSDARRGVTHARQALAEQYRLREIEPTGRSHRASPTAPVPEPQALPLAARRPHSGLSRAAQQLPPASRMRRVGSRGLTWARRAFLTASAAGLALALIVVALRWDALMHELSRPPSPSSSTAPPVIGPSSASAGQRMLIEAHRQLQSGDASAARKALERIAPEDPAYPFAQRMQLELPQRGEQR